VFTPGLISIASKPILHFLCCTSYNNLSISGYASQVMCLSSCIHIHSSSISVVAISLLKEGAFSHIRWHRSELNETKLKSPPEHRSKSPSPDEVEMKLVPGIKRGRKKDKRLKRKVGDERIRTSVRKSAENPQKDSSVSHEGQCQQDFFLSYSTLLCRSFVIQDINFLP